MRKLQIISLVGACIFLISAITGIQQINFSTGMGFLVAMHTPATRLITFVLGLVCVAWYLGLKQHTNWGIWGANLVFIGIISTCLLQGVDGAIKEDSAGAKIWSVGSQTGLAVVIFLAWRAAIRKISSTIPPKPPIN